MLYALHEAAYYASTPMPLREAARVARDFWGSPLNPAANTDLGRRMRTPAPICSPTSRAATASRSLEHRHHQGRPGRCAGSPDRGLGKPLGAARSSSTATWPICAGPGNFQPGPRRPDRCPPFQVTTRPCCAAPSRLSCPTMRCLSSTGLMPAKCRCWRAASTSTTISTTSSRCWPCWGRAPMSWPSASPGRPSWPPPP